MQHSLQKIPFVKRKKKKGCNNLMLRQKTIQILNKNELPTLSKNTEVQLFSSLIPMQKNSEQKHAT